MSTEHPGISRRHFLKVGAAAGTLGAVGGPALLSRRAMAAPALPATVPGGAGALVSFDGTTMPFSFVYNGQPSANLLASWPKTDQSNTSDPNVTRRTLIWTDPDTSAGQLQVTCEIGYYQDYPFTEWTVWFANIGSADSAELSTVLALDTWVDRTASEQFLVHAFNGSSDSLTDFAPGNYHVEPSDSLRLFTSTGGRPTNGTAGGNPDSTLIYGGFPYFNVDLGDGSGFVLAIGWPGQWATQFRREDQPLSMHLVAGMTSREWNSWAEGEHIESSGLLDTVLHAGEQIRTPLVVLQSWQAQDWIAAQNTWRRWMLAHNTPQINGGPPLPMCPTGTVDGYINPSTLIDAVTDELPFMAAYQAADTTVAGSGVNATTSGGGLYNWWWMDAGWYDTRVNGTGSDTDWTQVGTWVASPSRFPNGLSPVTDQARADGMKSIIWHEPERVRPGSWLAVNHPEWLLGTGDPLLLNLGNSDAWNWVVSTFDGLITSNGADCYRQDFNLDPLPYWNGADTAERSGMTQMRHVMGYLAYWDQLLALHPGLLIDSCASGGRRNDLETLRRAVPLLRSDDHLDALPGQCHTWGLSLWMPCQGTGASNDDYSARSNMIWAFATSLDVRSATNSDWDLIRRHNAEWNLIAANFTGDYYPLTPYSADDDVWMAFQYDRGDLGSGHLQVFRRTSESGSGTATFPLRGLDPAATYKLVVYGASAGNWTASDGFSDTQDLNNWHYEQRSIAKGAYSDLTFSDGAWRSTDPAPWIWADQCHAGYEYDAVRRWTAPFSGTVNITGAVYKYDTSGGNGIVATVQLNDTVIWSKTVAAADGTGYRTDSALAAVAVNAGDEIRFIVNDNGDYTSDRTGWNPVIDYNTAATTQSGASLLSDGFAMTLPQAAGAVVTYAQV